MDNSLIIPSLFDMVFHVTGYAIQFEITGIIISEIVILMVYLPISHFPTDLHNLCLTSCTEPRFWI